MTNLSKANENNDETEIQSSIEEASVMETIENHDEKSVEETEKNDEEKTLEIKEPEACKSEESVKTIENSSLQTSEANETEKEKFENKSEEEVEKKAEEKSEVKPEEKVEEKAVEKTEGKAEEKTEEKQEEKLEITDKTKDEIKSNDNCKIEAKKSNASSTTKQQPSQTQVTPTIEQAKSPFTMFQNKSQVSNGSAKIAANPARPVRAGSQTEAAKIKETILNWCIAKTEGYQNVQISNFSSSWNNGMAFCALIHHFCPDAFDFNKLDPKNRKGNFELAFKVAEDKCDISPLLEAEDMILMGNKPDSRCVFTYLSTMYQNLELKPQAKAAALAKKNEA